MNKTELKNLLGKQTGCRIQHTGWTCGTCFFAIDDSLTNEDWQTLLWFRGDYAVKDLNNLPPPEEREKSLKKIAKLCRKK